MQIKCTFRHTESTEALKKYASDKLEKVSKLLIKPTSAEVILSVEKFRHRVEMLVHAAGDDILKAVEESEDMYAAIDSAVDKLERQAKRIKGKIKGHQSQHRNAPSSLKGRTFDLKKLSFSPSEEEDLPDGRELGVAQAQTLAAPPMSVDEAIGELGASRQEFLVFTNRSTDSVNIFYRRHDGFFGLIQPDIVEGDGDRDGDVVPFRFEVYAMDEVGEPKKSRVIRSKDVSLKSMSLEESLATMRNSRNDFWVYTDAKNRHVNVVYRTSEGQFGLIETVEALH